MSAIIELSGISKQFPGVRALDNVEFSVEPGETHALMGENGAGKSTLIKVMTGALQPDGGTIRLAGKEIRPESPGAARAAGIGAVYQEVNLIPTMSVTKNLTLGRLPRKFGLIDWSAARAIAKAKLARLGVDIDVERPVGSYSVAIQQLIAIARALEDDARVLVLDEPTASLDANETERLFEIIRDLKARGLGIVFISHFIDQVYRISDRITVLRNGRRVAVGTVEEIPSLKLVSLMIGRELEHVEHQRPSTETVTSSKPILTAKSVGRRRLLEPFELDLRPGEVVGLAGLLGSGRTETAKLVFGAIRHDSGEIAIDGHPSSSHSPKSSLMAGITFCPEDRKSEGIVPELSVRENIILALQSKRGWLHLLSRKEQERLTAEMIAALNIATPDAEKPVGQLSGGNQQKVLLARSLVSNPRVLILDEPTRGIDVGAHAEIVTLIRQLAAKGMALLVASSELDELLTVSHRIEVMRDRRMVGEISGAEATREKIIQTIAAAS
ncbi:MAG: sugar ABC transporter ATP-binding protein [Ancalomicrobiaceae bacterium]|nr:sugar ABC transporter ATP-binding protein [Ancalomicrobiaceae bacterium]